MQPAALLQVAATALLNAGFAWLAGCLLTNILLPDRPVTRRAGFGAGVASMLGGAGVLWASAALMSDAGLMEAAPLWWPVAHGTGYGRATLFAMAAALVAALSLLWRRAALLGVAGLLGFALTRASVSHGGEGGWLTAGYAIDAAHLMLIGVWVGGVAVAAWRVLPAARRDGAEINAYLDRLSFAATLALSGIVASGAWSSWQRLSAPSDLLAHPWGMLLSLKLGLVGMAALMGGWNRCIGFPRAKRGASDPALLVLRIESLVLACILVLAAALTAQQPPTV